MSETRYDNIPEHATIIDEEIKPEYMQPRWIPVGERLPDAGANVLLFGEGRIATGGMGEVDTSALFWDDDDCNGAIEITHWQPLPPKPEVKP